MGKYTTETSSYYRLHDLVVRRWRRHCPPPPIPLYFLDKLGQDIDALCSGRIAHQLGQYVVDWNGHDFNWCTCRHIITSRWRSFTPCAAAVALVPLADCFVHEGVMRDVCVHEILRPVVAYVLFGMFASSVASSTHAELLAKKVLDAYYALAVNCGLPRKESSRNQEASHLQARQWREDIAFPVGSNEKCYGSFGNPSRSHCKSARKS